MTAAVLAACLAAPAWFAPQPSRVRVGPAPTNPARAQVAPQAQPHLDRVLEAVAQFLEVSVEDLGPVRVRRPNERGNITVGPLRVPEGWKWGLADEVYSVFVTGGAYPDGRMLLIVVFCRDQFAKSVAAHFTRLVTQFNSATASLSASGAIFSAPGD